MRKQSQYILFPDYNLKTTQIWKEAGFCPPTSIISLIETLHKSEECDILLTKPYDEAIFQILDNSTPYNQEHYQIFDTTRLKKMALDCGISVTNRDVTSLAQEVTRTILLDYGVYLTKNIREPDMQ